MGILSGYLGLEFFKHCYTPMGEIMDLLTLLVRKRPALRLGMHFQLLLNYLCLELYDQLYTLLHHVKTVQTDFQVKVNSFAKTAGSFDELYFPNYI